MSRITRRIGLAAAAVFGLIAAQPVAAQTSRRDTLRVAVHANLQILDPVWTTGLITLRHGYLIYDTLYGMNSQFEPRPQMVDHHTLSDDRLLWTFTLRDGLAFHDGQPVRAADVVASLRRWMQRDPMGQRLSEFSSAIEAVDDKTFSIRLRERYGLVLETLAKGTGTFIMPERVASTPSNTQITDTTGSGPFIFQRDEWRPGSRVVYRRNPAYQPREEPADFLSGGKRALVERVEWLYIPDNNTALAALNAGEIDYYEAPPLDFIPLMERNPDIKLEMIDPLGSQLLLRANWLYPPFNDVRARQALALVARQEDYMRVVVGNPRLYQAWCGAFFQCGSSNDTDVGSEPYRQPNTARARELLRQAGYNGERIVVLQPSDRPQYNAATMVLIQGLRRAGVNVDVQSMDWSTLLSRRARRDPPDAGGYHLFITGQGGVDTANPTANTWFNSRCDRANPGWACDMELDGMVADWARETDPAARRPLLERLHRRAWETFPYLSIGQFTQPVAVRSNIHGVLPAGQPVYWNIEKR
ncbi:peptide/nickel transport system substrate-binding protein [Humitalea rosea]|uniref:Peptide/nickel transport system substrate-binding protein n=1 Tax=Humitalea rosea TaxID=990373 RepID=A0A2W7KJE6_9PROT|nr:ABC transporter substrate-binding protein [Humitalea rosea]PZW48066.1 peptide/nickel transport system substrate-binding protein [Humitalea rosea]